MQSHPSITCIHSPKYEFSPTPSVERAGWKLPTSSHTTVVSEWSLSEIQPIFLVMPPVPLWMNFVISISKNLSTCSTLLILLISYKAGSWYLTGERERSHKTRHSLLEGEGQNAFLLTGVVYVVHNFLISNIIPTHLSFFQEWLLSFQVMHSTGHTFPLLDMATFFLADYRKVGQQKKGSQTCN